MAEWQLEDIRFHFAFLCNVYRLREDCVTGFLRIQKLLFFFFGLISQDLLLCKEGVHNSRKNKIQTCEGSQNHNGDEVNRRGRVRDRVLIVIHELGPAFERDDLEDGDSCLYHTVEIGDVVVDCFVFEGAIVDQRVQPVVTVDVTALRDFATIEIVWATSAHFIRGALPGGVFTDLPEGLP